VRLRRATARRPAAASVPARIELRPSDDPRASVVILTRHNLAKLAACLRSLEHNVAPETAYEVIVLLNDAEPGIETALGRQVSGARVLSSEVNLGFSGGNNRAARHARGEYLVLLNDDTEVEPRWLEALVEAADAHPYAGAVGSRMLFPDGRLQEAGSAIWSDGTTSPRGRGLPPGSRAFSALEPVDYCSASSLLVRRRTWDAVGGFDEEYAPAYYEDTDLCLAIAERGERVLYQPLSRVLHHESSSSDDSFKRFLFARNLERVRSKWARRLRDHEPPPRDGAPGALERAVHRARGCRPRVLAVDSRIPEERLGAGYPRMLDTLRTLSERFSVAFHPWERRDGDFSELGRLGIELVDGDLEEHLASPGVLYEAAILSRPNAIGPVIEALRRHQPAAALVYDVEALYYRRMASKAAVLEQPADAERAAARAEVMRRIEEAIAREVDRLVCLSPVEAEILARVEGHAPIELLEQYRPSARPTERGFRERRDMLYAAGWAAGADSPNADGLEWFATDILPAIREQVPWARLVVTGADPPTHVTRLAGPSIQFLGYVEDMHVVYDRARVVVVPMRYGAGVKMKTTEALQFGVPTVTTTIGADGVDLYGGAALEVTDDPREFAARVARLLRDPRAWEERRARLLGTPAPDIGTARWPQVIEAAMMGRAA
jgi:O-antigen biosynthesis protein